VFRERRKNVSKQQDLLQSSHKNFPTMSEPSKSVVYTGVYDLVNDPYFDKGCSDYERLKTIMFAQSSKMMSLDRGDIYQLDKYFFLYRKISSTVSCILLKTWSKTALPWIISPWKRVLITMWQYRKRYTERHLGHCSTSGGRCAGNVVAALRVWQCRKYSAELQLLDYANKYRRVMAGE
jgi:hypothetical protein